MAATYFKCLESRYELGEKKSILRVHKVSSSKQSRLDLSLITHISLTHHITYINHTYLSHIAQHNACIYRCVERRSRLVWNKSERSASAKRSNKTIRGCRFSFLVGRWSPGRRGLPLPLKSPMLLSMRKSPNCIFGFAARRKGGRLVSFYVRRWFLCW